MLASALAAVAVACGPSGADTLAQNRGRARVRATRHRVRLQSGAADRARARGPRPARVRRGPVRGHPPQRGLRRVAADLRPAQRAPAGRQGARPPVHGHPLHRPRVRDLPRPPHPDGRARPLRHHRRGVQRARRGSGRARPARAGADDPRRLRLSVPGPGRRGEPDRARRDAAQAGPGADQRAQRQPAGGPAQRRRAGRARRGTGRMRVLLRLLRDHFARAWPAAGMRRPSPRTPAAAANRPISRCSTSRPAGNGVPARTHAATC